MINPYMESGYYPHVKKDWKSRLKLVWRIFWHGDMFPQPAEWYEPLWLLVNGPYGTAAKRAVEKSEQEFDHTKATRQLRYDEAVQWFRTYVIEAKLDTSYQPWLPKFLIEWWVAQINKRF